MIVELSETILRALGAMLVQRVILHILPGVTKATAVQRGMLIRGNNYLQKVQETVGVDSVWTRTYMDAAGMAVDGITQYNGSKKYRSASTLSRDRPITSTSFTPRIQRDGRGLNEHN